MVSVLFLFIDFQPINIPIAPKKQTGRGSLINYLTIYISVIWSSTYDWNVYRDESLLVPRPAGRWVKWIVHNRDIIFYSYFPHNAQKDTRDERVTKASSMLQTLMQNTCTCQCWTQWDTLLWGQCGRTLPSPQLLTLSAVQTHSTQLGSPACNQTTSPGEDRYILFSNEEKMLRGGGFGGMIWRWSGKDKQLGLRRAEGNYEGVQHRKFTAGACKATARPQVGSAGTLLGWRSGAWAKWVLKTKVIRPWCTINWNVTRSSWYKYRQGILMNTVPGIYWEMSDANTTHGGFYTNVSGGGGGVWTSAK